MILNAGDRTDIPAFYVPWLKNRLREGCVLARNPYFPALVTRYRLDPEVVDVLVFCTKNPRPLLDDPEARALLGPFCTFWFVTVTPYGPDLEPRVPMADQVLADVRRLSACVGPARLSWRYDPVIVSEDYPVARHVAEFARMARALEGAVDQCVVSFVDLYDKTRRNLPSVRAVAPAEQEELVAAFAEAAAQCGMQVHLCCEDARLVRPHVDADGCMSRAVLERAAGTRLRVPAGYRGAREACQCLLGADIGAYNTCPHGCRYCYANFDQAAVARNRARHDPGSPLLVGHLEPGDDVRDARQASWRDDQLALF